MRQRINITLSDDTLERLDQYAFEQHVSRSQAIANLTWNAHVKFTQVRGQMSMPGYKESKTTKKSKSTK